MSSEGSSGGRASDLANELQTQIQTTNPEDFLRRNVNDESTMRGLVEDEEIDKKMDGESGLGEMRRAILKDPNNVAPDTVKRTASYRGREPKEDVLVPEEVLKNARVAMQTDKPVVLYGPTGTGKTVFAKQLAYEMCLDYRIHTANPEWTTSTIVGGLEPDSSSGNLSFTKSPGYITEAVQDATELDIPIAVIFDEITRADISKVFGPLYTAIENRNQTIFETDDDSIRFDERVKLICTMNMSDRTVNELDNAITRRFAMIELDEYEEDKRRQLYEKWVGEHLRTHTGIDIERLRELFEADHQGINEGETIDTDQAIMRFGPMHYSDIADFLRLACKEGGEYEGEEREAVGQAFATYIVPRLLNSIAYPYIDNIIQHYETLNDQFEEFDLQPAIELARRERDAQRRQTGMDSL